MAQPEFISESAYEVTYVYVGLKRTGNPELCRTSVRTEFCAPGYIVTEDEACRVYPCFGNVTAAEIFAKTGCRD